MDPNITLYTAHHCPFAHRVQVVLRELNLRFDTVLIDITVPRTANYLTINPSGTVPALIYNDHVLTESGLTSQFLMDSHPSHLALSSTEPTGPLQRFNIGYFVDTYFSKAHQSFDSIVVSLTTDAKIEMADKYIDAVVKHVEPLLTDAAPFFRGSDRLTLAEALAGPFILRVIALPKYEHIVPSFILPALQNRAPHFWKWAGAVVIEPSITTVWDEELVVRRTLEKIEKLNR